MDGDYFTVMGLISALNDFSSHVRVEPDSFIKAAFCLPTSSIIHLIVDNHQQIPLRHSFISDGNLHSCSLLSHSVGLSEQTQVGRDALAVNP